MLPWELFLRETRDWPDSFLEREASRVRRIAAVRSASACDQTVKHTPWYVMVPLLLEALTSDVALPPGVWPLGDRKLVGGPKNAEEGRACFAKGSSVYG